jgi:hypothetical protein
MNPDINLEKIDILLDEMIHAPRGAQLREIALNAKFRIDKADQDREEMHEQLMDEVHGWEHQS